ncbi:hypothetical protein TWF281_000878 [Arthrobotrys megalospora]
MVSTRRRGSPEILMLDDHEQPVQQSSAPLAKSPAKQPKRSVKASPKKQAEKQVGKQAENKSTRNTRSNPNPNEKDVLVSEPERLLHQKPGSRKIQKNVRRPPKTTNPEKDVFNLPSSDGEGETGVIATPRKSSTGLRSRKSGAVRVKAKGRVVTLKPLRPDPVTTVEAEAVRRNEEETGGEGGDPEATAEGDDGDDERDEGDALEGDDTLGGPDPLVPGEDVEFEPEDEPEEESEEEPERHEKRLGEPFQEQPSQPGMRTDKAREQGDEERKKKKKRRKDIGTYHGDYEDESELDEDTLRQMTMQEFETKFRDRAATMEFELNAAFSNIENDRKSIDRRLKALETVVMDTVEEFNDHGVYNEVYRGGKHHNRYKPFPKTLPGDPFPDGALDFDENHPAIKALFPDEKTAYEVDIFNEHGNHIERALAAANNLHRIAEKIWLTSTRYKTILNQQKKFVERCRDHAKTVKVRYISGRVAERVEALKAERLARQGRYGQELDHRREHIAKYPSTNMTPNRKRALDVPDTIDPKRQKMHHQNRSSGRHQVPTTEPEPEPEPESEPESGTGSEPNSSEGPRTPPPADRVIIELFGDHTPGRTRRIHRNPEAQDDQAARQQSGIHDDNAPWTAEENEALDTALKAFQEKSSRWYNIKKYYGGPGTVLAERSLEEIRDKAREYKTRIKNSGQRLPDYWELVSYSSDDEAS